MALTLEEIKRKERQEKQSRRFVPDPMSSASFVASDVAPDEGDIFNPNIKNYLERVGLEKKVDRGLANTDETIRLSELQPEAAQRDLAINNLRPDIMANDVGRTEDTRMKDILSPQQSTDRSFIHGQEGQAGYGKLTVHDNANNFMGQTENTFRNASNGQAGTRAEQKRQFNARQSQVGTGRTFGPTRRGLRAQSQEARMPKFSAPGFKGSAKKARIHSQQQQWLKDKKDATNIRSLANIKQNAETSRDYLKNMTSLATNRTDNKISKERNAIDHDRNRILEENNIRQNNQNISKQGNKNKQAIKERNIKRLKDRNTFYKERMNPANFIGSAEEYTVLQEEAAKASEEYERSLGTGTLGNANDQAQKYLQ